MATVSAPGATGGEDVRWGASSAPPWWQDPTKLTNEAVSSAKDDLRRELVQQRELLAERIARLEAIIHDLDQRFSSEIGRRVDASYNLLAQRDDSIDSRLALLSEVAGDAPEVHDALRLRLQADISIAMQNLKELHQEKFAGIQQQFTERDIRADQDKRASKDALDAALLAQKEAVAQQNDANTTAATKSETSFTKQIDQIGTLIATLEKSLTDRITELKERIDRGEGQGQGVDKSEASSHDVRALEQAARLAQAANLRATLGVIVGGIGLLLAIVLGIIAAIPHH